MSHAYPCKPVVQRCLAIVWLSVAAPAVAQTDPPPKHKIIATKSSKVFHDRPCSFTKRINQAKAVRFESVEAAEKSGRRRCRFCERLAERGETEAEADPPAKPPSKPRRPEPGSSPPPPAGSPETAPSKAVAARIKDVLPGGTLVRDDGERLRLVGVLCPERGQALADEAVRLIQRHTRRRTVNVVLFVDAAGHPRRDPLGRLLAEIRIESKGEDLAALLVEKGLAWLDPRFRSERRMDYRLIEDAAVWAERGIWARLDGDAGRRPVIVGKHAPHFHAPDCFHVPHLTDTKRITINQAKDKRLTPCRLFRDARRAKPKEN